MKINLVHNETSRLKSLKKKLGGRKSAVKWLVKENPKTDWHMQEGGKKGDDQWEVGSVSKFVREFKYI